MYVSIYLCVYTYISPRNFSPNPPFYMPTQRNLQNKIHPNLSREHVEELKGKAYLTSNITWEPGTKWIKSIKFITKFIRNNNKQILTVLLSEHAHKTQTQKLKRPTWRQHTEINVEKLPVLYKHEVKYLHGVAGTQEKKDTRTD
jgi:hypothetical protein